jgi:hypothetical protein
VSGGAGGVRRNGGGFFIFFQKNSLHFSFLFFYNANKTLHGGDVKAPAFLAVWRELTFF